MDTGFWTQVALGVVTSGAAWGLSQLVGQLIDRSRARSTTVTFEARDHDGKWHTIIVPKNPTPEQTERALEEIRRVGTLARQH